MSRANIKHLYVIILLMISDVNYSQVATFEKIYPSIVKEYSNQLSSIQDPKNISTLFKMMQDTLINTKQSYLLPSLMPYYEQYRLHPKADSMTIRKEYTKYGYVLKSIESFIEPAVKVYLVAHNYGSSSSVLNDYWYVENVLGTLYNMKGDHEKSLHFYLLAKEGLKTLILKNDGSVEKYDDQILRLNNNIAYLHYWNKEYAMAEQILIDNVKQSRLQKNYLAENFGLGYLIQTYTTTNQVEKILPLLAAYEATIPLLPESKKRANEIIYNQTVGEYFLANNECKQAKDYFNKCVMEFEFEHSDRFMAKNFIRLAKAYLLCGEVAHAQSAIVDGYKALKVEYPQILTTQSEWLEENTIAELMEVQSSIYMSRFEQDKNIIMLDSAMLALQKALSAYQQIRTRFTLEGSKVLIAADQRRICESISFILKIKYETDKNQWLKQARPYLMQSKNTLQTDLEIERLTIEKMNEQDSKKIQSILEQIRILTTQNSNSKDNKQISINNNKIFDYRTQIQKLAIKQKTTLTHSKRSSPYVEFIIVKNEVWRIDNLNGLETISVLGDLKACEELIALIRRQITEQSDEVYLSLHNMYKYLFGSIQPLPQRVGILADGFLHYIPFACLVTDIKSLQFLVEKTEIYHIVSRNINIANTSKTSGTTIFIPNYENTDHNEILTPLIYAEQEGRSIEKTMTDSKVMRTFDKEAFFGHLKTQGLIHYGGHAMTNDQKPVLAISNDQRQWIGISEITRAPIAAHTIVLSACETGTGVYQAGEGLYSLAKAFINAGSRTVISTLWQVNDQTTADIMANIYRQYKETDDMVAATNQAQRQYLASAKGEARHPYYWAAITVAQSDVQDQSYLWAYALLVFTFLAIIYFIYKIKTK